MLIVSLTVIVLLPLGCRKAFKERPTLLGKAARNPWKLTAVTSKIVSRYEIQLFWMLLCYFCEPGAVLALHVDHLFRICVAALWGLGAPEPSLRLSEVTKLGSGRDRAWAPSGRARLPPRFSSDPFQGSVCEQHPVPSHGVEVRPPGSGVPLCH